MPISPTGSLRSFRGFTDQDHNRPERIRSPSSQRPTLGTTDAGARGSGSSTSPTIDDGEQITKPSLNSTSDRQSAHQARPSPKQDSPSRLAFTFTAAPHESPRLSRANALAGQTDTESIMTATTGLYLATNDTNPSSLQLHPPSSPLSSSSGGSGGIPPQLHSDASTPPSAVKSPASGGSFFSILRPNSPRVAEGSSAGLEKRRQKERNISTNERGGEGSRESRERGFDVRSRKNSSIIFDHVGSVFERIGKKVHSRSESREPRITSDGQQAMFALTAEQQLRSSDADPTVDHIELLEELATRPPPLLRNLSNSSSLSTQSVEDPAAGVSVRYPLSRMLIQVTEDNERFLVVDISGLDSAAGIKERMLSKLHRFEDDPSSFIFYRTEVGLSDGCGPPIAEDSLWTACKALGDDKGNLKFLIKQLGPPARPTSTGPPPSATSSSIVNPRNLKGRILDSNGSPQSPQVTLSPSQSGPTSSGYHTKAESISSLSSTGDAALNCDSPEQTNGAAGMYDSGSEAGRKKGLARSRGVSRRSFASGSGGSGEDSRLSAFSQSSSSRPSSGLLAVREQRSESATTDATTTAHVTGQGYESAAETQESRDSEARRASDPPLYLRDEASSGQAEEIEELHQLTLGEEQSPYPRRYSRASPQRPATSLGYSSDKIAVSSIASNMSPSISPMVDASEVDRTQSGPSLMQRSGDDLKKHQGNSRDAEEHDRRHNFHDAARMYNQSDADYEQMLARNLAGGSLRPSSKPIPASLQPMRSMGDLKGRKELDSSTPGPPNGEGATSRARNSGPLRGSLSQYLPEDIKSPPRDGRYPSVAVPRKSAPTPHRTAPSEGGSRRPESTERGPQPRASSAARPVRASPEVLASGGARPPAHIAGQGSHSSQPPPPSTSMRLATSSDGAYREHPSQQAPQRGTTRPRPAHSGATLSHDYHSASHARSAQQIPGAPGVSHQQHLQHPQHAQYANEFGARMYADPRTGNYPYNGPPPTAVPFPQRPHTFHDTGNIVSGHYRPGPIQPFREPPEDPYIQARFPASSARQVSEFQRTGQATSLSPGMTVQETLMHRRQSGGQESSPHTPHPHFGPREPRAVSQPQPSPQWDPRSAHHLHQQQMQHLKQQHQQQQYLQQQQQQQQWEASSFPHPPPLVPRSSWEMHQPSQNGTHPQSAHRPSLEYHNTIPSTIPSPQNQATRIMGAQSFPGNAPPQRGTNSSQIPQQYRGPYPPPSGVQPHQSSIVHTRSSNGARQHNDVAQWSSGTSASDRSSGSSLVSVESDAAAVHQRDLSRESNRPRSSVDDSTTAPSSVRSSGSGPQRGHLMMSPESSLAPTSLSPSSWPQNQFDRDSQEEIDVSKIRPLPRLPESLTVGQRPANSVKKVQPRDGGEDDGTLKAAQWASLLASADGDGDTLKAPRIAATASPSATVKAASPSPSPMSSSSSTVKSRGRNDSDIMAGGLHLDDLSGGTFASFADDDDDEEGGTWAKPLDATSSSAGSSLTSLSQTSGADHDLSGLMSDGTQTLKPPSRNLNANSSSGRVASPSRRPELRLTIDAPPSSAAALAKARLSPRNSPGLSSTSNAGNANLTSAFSPGIHRKSSFARRDNAWVMRPPPEQLYENLDEFFPRHDLDKPVLDAAAAGAPPSPSPAGDNAESPRATSSGRKQSTPTSPTSASSLTRHKKSIRRVAEDRMRFMEMSGASTNTATPTASRRGGAGGLTALSAANSSAGSSYASTSTGQALARRRSTRLWGTKLLEMKPGSEQVSKAAQMSSSGSASADSAESMPIFKWVKGDLIGKGTYGRVYLALNATTGEMIAVKQVELPRTESDREDNRQKGVVTALKSEIDTLKDLDHPNIVSYLGFEETPKYLHLFLEYVPGGSIASVLRKYGPMEEGVIKFFVFQILSGLTYLHERGVLHRDLKGDNLLVTLDGTVKISDFGTVRKSDNIYSNVEGMSLQGSVFWMAPEVVTMSKKGYSAKVDIWSLGCVVLEMLAGRRPWSDDEAVQAMFKIGKEGRAPPIPPDVRPSPEAAHFLKKCFELDPDSRPTASRLLEHVFPYNKEDWSFTNTLLYQTMKNSVKNR